MTITNRELFYRDPAGTKIPNDGVSRIVQPETPEQWEVLRWELESFVCKGQYERGLQLILDSFFKNLHKPQQPAVWVSGFYGSGKSHLVRVLEQLWRDTALPNGDHARDLVKVPDGVSDHLRELTTESKRVGGVWTAAGTLAAGKSDAVRLAFLSVLFESAGLPQQLPLARFLMWATDEGYVPGIEAALVAKGRTLDTELPNLYVSPIIAESLIAQAPNIWSTPPEVLDKLRARFPPATKDISDDEMFAAMDAVLRRQAGSSGKWPLTLIVLDEMQQYINDDNDRATDVQLLVEGCRDRYKSHVLIVATGQDELGARPALQKLLDRFPVTVALSATDVETVVREVVLQKKPEHVAELKAVLDDASGEIAKHLGGTQLAPKAADKPDLVQDYPLLPTRRRFWDLALRAIDRAGKTGVLRTQLRIMHEAAASVAAEPIGHVVGADFLYEEQSTGMLQSQVLVKEIDELIRGLRTAGADGPLKSRICALVFLISQIPSRTIGGETGLRATAAYLADLLVEDLENDGATMRRSVPEMLDSLVSDGHLMQVEDEYLLQTEAGAEWEKDYRSRLGPIGDDAGRMNQLRSERLIAAVDAALGGLKLIHGVSKTPRKIDVRYGQDEPVIGEGEVPVWIRDEWSTTEASVKKAAAEAGDENPIVFVLLPKHEPVAIKDTLASFAAAEDTLRRATPQTDEGKSAQRAMKTRHASDDERLLTLFQEVVARARVFQGGGTELTTSTLRAAVETAANRSLIRLFSKFDAGDNANWGTVVQKARDGAPDALLAVGHHGDPTTHPVCKEVLATISSAGTKGSDLQKQFSGPPYGWPKDAVTGAILTLFAAGNISATQDGKELAGPKELPQTQIGKVVLKKEDEPPTMPQRLAVRGLLADAGIAYAPGQEGAEIPALLQRLKDLASRAGGVPPLPEPPDSTYIDGLVSQSGNQRFRAVADVHEQLGEHLSAWRASDDKRSHREAEWSDLQRLLRHADELPVAQTVAPGVKAIGDGRLLLDDPDPIAPIRAEVSLALRSSVTHLAESLSAAVQQAVADLEASDRWTELASSDRAAILAEAKLTDEPAVDVSSDTKLLDALDATPLSAWEDRIGIVASRRDQARQRAAKKLEPESVTVDVPKATIKSATDLQAYLDEVRARVQPHLDAHQTVIL